IRKGALPDSRTAVVTKIRSPQTMGLECPSPGTSARHNRPESLPAAGSTFQAARVGYPSAIPRAPGPRNSGQFCSVLESNLAAGKAVNVVIRNVRRESGIYSPEYPRSNEFIRYVT